MGEVYLAHDSQLDRTIALKILPAEVASDQQRMHRFEQEARAASALNHQNVAHIYEIGQESDINFIAMEFIDGQTLRERLRSGRLSLSDALGIAIQIADALAVAHEAGIIHRDIKPENIMVRRRDSYVKVLDFGLAKLKQRHAASIDTDAPTKPLLNTGSGVVLGTAQYMSPEQARGLEVDERTDIFSFGAVLYEIVAGQKPFAGETAADVAASILKAEPQPLTHLAPEAPARLEEIVSKALEKDREERYQTVKDLLIDLRRVKKRIDFEVDRERFSPSTSSGGTQGESRGQPIGQSHEEVSARRTDPAVSQTTTSAAPGARGPVPIRSLITIGLVFVVILGLGFGVYKFIESRKPTAAFQTMKLTQLTTTGNILEAAISPDGKYVAYTAEDVGQQSIWIKQVATGSDVQIVPPAKGFGYLSIAFSADSNYLYFFTSERNEPVFVLHQIPAMGGTARKVGEANGPSGIAVSPDRQRLAFTSWEGTGGQRAVVVMNVDGTGRRAVVSRQMPISLTELAWSPDGQSLACLIGDSSDGDSFSLVELRVADATVKPLGSRKWSAAGRLAWLPDGSGLILPASDQPSREPQLWHISYPDGEARRVTNDLNGYASASVTTDSAAMVTVQREQRSNIWLVPRTDAGEGKQITFGASKHDGREGLTWTPGGQIVYHSMASGNPEVWIMNGDGTNQKQITINAGGNTDPAVSPDGRYIAVVSDRSGRKNMWRIDLDGGNQVELTQEIGLYPSFSADSKWVVHERLAPNGGLAKVSIDGGASSFIVDHTTVLASRGVVSPDGKWIACNYLPALNARWALKIAVIPFDGGPPVHTFDITTIDVHRQLRWLPDGRAIAYLETRDGVSNIWSQPLAGGQPKQLTNFKSDQIFSFDWSRDGRWLAAARGTITSDVVLINNLK